MKDRLTDFVIAVGNRLTEKVKDVLNVPQKLQTIYHELKLLNIGKKTII